MKGIKNGGRLTDRQVGFLLVVPGLAVFAAIILYPFVDAVLMSFTGRSLLYPDYDWVWLENYVKVFKYPYFLPTLGTTALFVVLATLIPFVLGFIWAILLNQGFKGSELLRGLTLVLALGTIGNLQHFDLPWTMTEGGPARATTTLSIEVCTTAFKNWDMGKAATVGTIWALLLACFSFVYLRQVNESD